MVRLMKAALLRFATPVFEKVIHAVTRDNISPGELRVLKDEEDWEDSLVYERERGRQQEKEEIVLSLISEGLDRLREQPACRIH